MSENKEKRESRLFEIRAQDGKEEGQRMLVGYAAVFDSLSENLGGFRERIKPGAFAGAIKTSDVRALYNHDSNQIPLGRSPETLRLLEDETGLKVEIDIPDTQLGRDLLVSIDRGDVSQMSFGFSVNRDGQEWEDKKDGYTVRTLTEIHELFDVSPVVYPAYPDTSIAQRSLEAMRKENAPNLDNKRRLLDIKNKSMRL
jgi:HK97 family phage prohead protease